MNLAIILTNDWELFGNGSGDYFKNQKEPLNDLLKSINGHGFKITLFAEVIQQLNLIGQPYDYKMAHVITSDWEKTIKDLLAEGHDIQLHIHPQLLKNKDETQSEWSIANLNKVEMYEVICDGKNYLESVLRMQDPNYECIAFRAGAYAIQPSHNVLNNLYKAGIKCDSSVTNGLVSSLYDFRNSYSSYFPWFSNANVTEKNKDETSILEIPIFSVSKIDSPFFRVKFPFHYNLFFHYTRLTKKEMQWIHQTKKGKTSSYSLKEKYQSQASKSLLKLVYYKIIQPHSFQFDYDKVPARVLIKYLVKLNNRLQSNKLDKYENCFIPVVLIGHAKEHHSNDNMILFMELLKQEFQTQYKSFTISEYYQHFMNHLKTYEQLENDLNSEKLLF